MKTIVPRKAFLFIASLLLTASCSSQDISKDHYTALETGDLQGVEQLINEGADPNHVFPSPPEGITRDSTPLHIVAYLGHVDIVKLLLEAGANPNKKDALEETPLHKAAFSNHPAIVNILLEAGANSNAQSFDGRTPLHEGAFSLPIVKQLLAAGADPNKKSKLSKTTPLHAAASGTHSIHHKGIPNNSPKIVQMMLEAGADPNARSEPGPCNTPWHNAGLHGKGSKVRLILKKHGAKIPEINCD